MQSYVNEDRLFYTDASQSIGKMPVDVEKLGVDFLSLAGHKVYAPKGIGALFIKEGIEIEPFIHGEKFWRLVPILSINHISN